MPTDQSNSPSNFEQLIATSVERAIEKQFPEQEPLSTHILADLTANQLEKDIQLWKPYDAKEVALFLGLSQSSVYSIPENELCPTWVGQGKGSKRYLGINILCYIAGIEPVDTEAVARQRREAFLKAARKPPTPPSSTSGKQRVC